MVRKLRRKQRRGIILRFVVAVASVVQTMSAGIGSARGRGHEWQGETGSHVVSSVEANVVTFDERCTGYLFA